MTRSLLLNITLSIIVIASLSITTGCKQKDPPKQPAKTNETTTAANTPEQTLTQPGSDDWATPIELTGCPNLHKVSDTLYRGAQPEDEGFPELDKMGIKTVVCLRRWHDDEEEIEGTNLDYVGIPMNTWKPTEENVLKFLRTATDPTRQPVFVHCQHGADRTGTMVAIYRIAIEDWSKEDALNEMQNGPFGYHEIWKMLPEFIKELDVEKLKADLTDSDNPKIFKEQLWKYNWPHPNPIQPPSDKRYSNLTPKQLIPHVLNESNPEGPDGCRLACAWFIWKTRNSSERHVLRNELANEIVKEIRKIDKDPNRMVHDVAFWAGMLGPLNAREHTLSLLEELQSIDCCYGPNLIYSLAECGNREDISVLIELLDKESEVAGGSINDALEKLTDTKMPLTKLGQTDKLAWQEWWEKNKNI